MENTNQTTEIQEIEVNKDYALMILANFFRSLEDATGDTMTTLSIIEKITQAIQANPEGAKNVFTPENVENFMLLKQKIDNGTFHVNDLERAFPLVTNIPLWSTLRMLIK